MLCMELDLNPDVTVYTRHAATCAVTDPHHKKCGCPKWLYIKATQKRISAKTTVWSVAEEKAQALRDGYNPLKRRVAELEQVQERKRVLIQFAIERWLPSNKRAPSTLKGYSATLRDMREFLANRGVFYLHEITPDHLLDWTASPAWTRQATGYNRTRRIHLVVFFGFCIRRMKWLSSDQDPSGGLPSYGSAEIEPVIPFERDEYEAILDATERFDQARTSCWCGHPEHGVEGCQVRTVRGGKCRCVGKIVTGARLRTFIQVMRWSGLAIRDTVILHRSRLSKDDVLQVRRIKTRTPVTVPLPHAVADELRNIPPVAGSHPDYFFGNPTAKPASLAGLWSSALFRLWPLVKWPGVAPTKPHSHMFRHTFAAEYLKTARGDGIRRLAKLLGHTSIKTTEQNYLAFVPSHAEELNESVRASFAAQGAPGYTTTNRKPVRSARPRNALAR